MNNERTRQVNDKKETLYERAFEMFWALWEAQEAFSKAHDLRVQNELKYVIKSLQEKLEKASRHPDLDRFAAEYIAKDANNLAERFNMQSFIRDVRAAGLCPMITDSAIRKHMEFAFEYMGARGRPKK